MKPRPGQEGVHLPIADTDGLCPNRREGDPYYSGPAPYMQGGTQMVQDYGPMTNDTSPWRGRPSPASAQRTTPGLVEKPAKKETAEVWPPVGTGLKR